MQQKTVQITLQCSNDFASEMQEIDLLNTFQCDYNKVELMKLSFEMYKWRLENECIENQKSVLEIYEILSNKIWGANGNNDLGNVSIVSSFPNVDIAPIYCISIKENGLIAAITKVLVIDTDIPEIASKGIYVQEIYVNTVNADFGTISGFIGIPNNAIIKLRYGVDAKLLESFECYNVEFYNPVIGDVSLIASKGLYVVSEIGNLSRNLLNELKNNEFGACMQSLVFLSEKILMTNHISITMPIYGLDGMLLAEIQRQQIIRQEIF